MFTKGSTAMEWGGGLKAAGTVLVELAVGVGVDTACGAVHGCLCTR
jgi:hypothetical protein